ncbi:CLUMA_CG020470, isoform A [Clunio marinus]|uniref:Nicastrin n=1 Tax=Clunio marinus TaxID=568069 RepID=A0A1J1J526_9DIPT|nr:CLUMA_CG020470, isoform A [Clunio marinus]
MKTKLAVISLTLLGAFLSSVFCDRTKENMYEDVYGSMCFRRLNATHQTGCSSNGKSRGSVGVLHLISSDSDINFLLNKPPAPPYAAIVTPKHFTRENILKLRDSTFISAIVLINDTQKVESFSQESKCPNEFFTHSQQPTCDILKPETTWNPFGTGLLQENFEIPIIFLSNRNESEKVIKCFNDFNKDFTNQKQRSLCSIEINSFMSAAGNSEICMRRTEIFKLLNQIHYCDPLQGKNVYATLFPREIVSPKNRTIDESEKIILVTARLDTTSMFDGLGLGAMDSLASAATLITSGHYLKKLISLEKLNDKKINVMFMIFNGESYDYIGSQRFVYDLKKGDAFPSPSSYTKPLNLSNIMLMIDIGNLDSFTDITMYQLKDSDFGNNLISSFQYYNDKLKLNINFTSKTTNNLPPVSAQTFLRENSSFPAFIVATTKPENKFYHSVYDDMNNLNFTYFNLSADFDQLDSIGDSHSFTVTSVQIKIRNAATLVALGIYDILNKGQKYNGTYVASSQLVDEYLYCYLIASKCRLFSSIFEFQGSFHGNDFPPQRYISVQATVTLEATWWAYRVLGFVLSENIKGKTKDNCTVLPDYWIPGSNMTGECRLTTQNFSLALSPAFEEVDYNFKSNRYSTWTESTWNELSARIFLRPSPTHESLTFSIGFVVMILSFVIVYIVNSKSDVLFTEMTVEHVSLPAQC